MTDQFREAIRRSDKSFNRLARESGVSVAAISRIAAGKRGVGLKAAQKLAPVLGLRFTLEPDDQHGDKGS